MSTNTENIKFKKKLRPAEIRSLWISRLFLVIMIFIVLFPVLSVIGASMAKGEAFTQTTIFPKEFSLENYVKVLTETDFLVWMKNSLIVCFAISIIQLILTIPTAYAFSKLKFTGRKKGLMFLLLLQMFPTTMALPAILAVVYRFNGMDQLLTLVLIQCGASAYNIWLMKGFMDGIPKELTEAAYVDGANQFEAFIKVILPLTKNMLLVIFLFTFIGAYSEFIFASAIMKDPASQTIPIGLQQFIRNQFSTNWTQYSAAAIMSSVPIVILATFGQKYMAKGLVAGSVKG